MKTLAFQIGHPSSEAFTGIKEETGSYGKKRIECEIESPVAGGSTAYGEYGMPTASFSNDNAAISNSRSQAPASRELKPNET